MKEWNERRLEDFFRMNFDKGTCKREISGEEMTVTDNEGESLKLILVGALVAKKYNIDLTQDIDLASIEKMLNQKDG